MRIFVSYKSEDLNKVEEIVEKLREISPDVMISIIRQSKRWKKLARKYIKKADMIIYLAGYIYSENIDWEINKAIKMGNKINCIKLYEDVILDEKLYIKDSFDDKHKKLRIENPISLSEMMTIIKGNREYLYDKLFQNNKNQIDDNALMEQYKMMLSTSESLIERRQKLTTTYLSIFSALIPIISLMLSKEILFLNIGVVIISLISIILCFSWRNSILSYGKSNRAKFAILEELEQKLPASIFSSEWIALKKITSKYKSFTDRETMIPLLFCFVYIVFMLVSILMCFFI